MGRDYTPITEVPGIGADKDQLARLYHRYHLASRYCTGKRALEVACGPGIGLGYLARTASFIVGGDLTASLVRTVYRHYQSRVPVLQMDAHALPFREGSFDTVILFEALYYLANPRTFLDECRRVLVPDGTLVLSTVNKEWADFSPSMFSTEYLSARELSELLGQSGFDSELFAAFPIRTGSAIETVVSLMKRTAVAARLMPRSMRAKQLLRRMFFGKLSPLPSELQAGWEEKTPTVPITLDGAVSDYKILYAVAHPRTGEPETRREDSARR